MNTQADDTQAGVDVAGNPVNHDVVVRRIPTHELAARAFDTATSKVDIFGGCQGRCMCPSFCGFCEAPLNLESKVRVIVRRLKSQADPDGLYREIGELCCRCLMDVHCYLEVPSNVDETITRALRLSFRLQHAF
jgi:hypothetical protein